MRNGKRDSKSDEINIGALVISELIENYQGLLSITAQKQQYLEEYPNFNGTLKVPRLSLTSEMENDLETALKLSPTKRCKIIFYENN